MESLSKPQRDFLLKLAKQKGRTDYRWLRSEKVENALLEKGLIARCSISYTRQVFPGNTGETAYQEGVSVTHAGDLWVKAYFQGKKVAAVLETRTVFQCPHCETRHTPLGNVSGPLTCTKCHVPFIVKKPKKVSS